MDYVAALQASVDYIEHNLQKKLCLEHIADRAGLSPHHFHRIFSAFTGWGVGGYIRARRLSKAAQQVVTTAEPLSTIAVSWCFANQAAFTRAFERQFGITPGKARRKKYPLSLCVPMRVRNIKTRSLSMQQQPKFEKRGPFTVVGLKITANMQNGNPFTKMWDDFLQRADQVKHVAKLPQYGQVGLGLCWCDCQGECTCGDESDFHAMASFVVDKAVDIPQGMESREIPAQEYAVFEYKGPLGNDLSEAYDYIYKTWLPQSGRQPGGTYSLEWYDNRFEYGKEESIFDILIPVSS